MEAKMDAQIQKASSSGRTKAHHWALKMEPPIQKVQESQSLLCQRNSLIERTKAHYWELRMGVTIPRE